MSAIHVNMKQNLRETIKFKTRKHFVFLPLVMSNRLTCCFLLFYFEFLLFFWILNFLNIFFLSFSFSSKIFIKSEIQFVSNEAKIHDLGQQGNNEIRLYVKIVAYKPQWRPQENRLVDRTVPKTAKKSTHEKPEIQWYFFRVFVTGTAEQAITRHIHTYLLV